MGLEGTPAGGGGSPWETGEGCRIELGASLPPRKRLLAGLKQNGWLSTPSATAPSFTSWQSTAAGPRASEELKLEVDLDGAKMIVEATKPDDGQQYVGNGRESSNAVEEAKILTEDDKDLDHGKSNIEPKYPTSPPPTSSSFAHAEKTPRLSRVARSRQREFNVNGACGDLKAASAFDSGVPSSRTKRKVVPANEMVVAAKLTAAIAAKTAAEARATAAAKAEAAAKAAAVAKAALDAAAILARKEARNLRRNSARARSRAMEKNKKTDMKRERTELRVSQMSPPVNDEELARQLHRAINSSPRISRSQTPLQPKGSSKFVEVKPAIEWIKGSPSTSKTQGKNQRVRPRSLPLKEGRKQEVKTARESSRRLQRETVSQYTNELNKSPRLDAADTVTSFQRSGSMPGEHAGESKNDFAHLENAGTFVNESAIDPSSQDEKLNKGADMNKACNLVSPTFLESTTETSNLSTCKHVDGSKRRHVESEVPELGKGEDEIIKDQVCAGKDLDEEMLAGLGQNATAETRSGKSQDMLLHNYARVPQADEEGRQEEKQWDVESQKQTDDFTENTVEAKQKVSAADIEDENIKRLDMDRGGSRDNSSRKERHLMKHRSLDRRSKTFAEKLSATKHARAGVPSWHNGKVKGLSSGAESFGGGINLTPFGSAPPVPLRTPTFASGPTARHS